MGLQLVIVESPAKANTIKKYLGPGFEVLASYGHVRDLLPKEGAVDPEHGFQMTYELIERNEKQVDKIAREMKKADALFLATDLDREGEAISWHLLEILNERGVLNDKPVYRVVFNEITKRAIQDAINSPREVAMDLVNAQQARRALDYLVGFNLSPLLWKKIKRGLSAGRVQSPALRLICEREREIERFEAQEYWTIEAHAETQPDDGVSRAVAARLYSLKGERVKQFTLTDEAGAHAARDTLVAGAAGELLVTQVERKQRKRNPAPPFITSTLQQEASRKLGFTAQRTMRVAQQLYEGLDVGEGGASGLITYMRTDSVNLSNEAIDDLRSFIKAEFGADNLPETPRQFKKAQKNAQEAHEAIRPSSAFRRPADLRRYLSEEQFRLYELIFKRSVACQMIHATIDTVAVDLAAGDAGMFRATGSTIRIPGFMALYLEGTDDASGAGGDDKERVLPPLSEGDRLRLNEVKADQHFTEPPPRYTEASLVKTLEEFGIGRPSTYASIISTLVNREYVEYESKRFQPTDIGRLVNDFLTNHFEDYVDYEFTARLEDRLDEISRGEQDWVPLLEEFWQPFIDRVRDKEANVSREEANQARYLGDHPKSGKPVSVRMGRFGPYVIIGSPEDEEKPQFFGLKPGQKMDAITLDDAMELTKLPRVVGDTPDGHEVTANIGRFGPYVRYDGKFVSLGKEDDPYTIELPRALELIEAKKKADAERFIKSFEEQGIQVLKGRYGPYITNGAKNARVPKDREPETLTLEECEALLEAAPDRRRGKKKAAAKKTEAKKATAKKAVTKKKTTKKKAKKKAASKKATGKKTAAKKKTSKKAATVTSAEDVG